MQGQARIKSRFGRASPADSALQPFIVDVFRQILASTGPRATEDWSRLLELCDAAKAADHLLLIQSGELEELISILAVRCTSAHAASLLWYLEKMRQTPVYANDPSALWVLLDVARWMLRTSLSRPYESTAELQGGLARLPSSTLSVRAQATLARLDEIAKPSQAALTDRARDAAAPEAKDGKRRNGWDEVRAEEELDAAWRAFRRDCKGLGEEDKSDAIHAKLKQWLDSESRAFIPLKVIESSTQRLVLELARAKMPPSAGAVFESLRNVDKGLHSRRAPTDPALQRESQCAVLEILLHLRALLHSQPEINLHRKVHDQLLSSPLGPLWLGVMQDLSELDLWVRRNCRPSVRRTTLAPVAEQPELEPPGD